MRAQTPLPLAGTGDGERLSAEGQESLAEFLHAALNHNIALADRKAGILFTLVSGALLYLLESRDALSRPALNSLEGLLWLIMLICLLVSAGAAFSVIYPRVRGARDGALFWGCIGRQKSPEPWLARIRASDPAVLRAARLHHCHALARVCREKFRLLRLAMMSGLLGLLAFLAARLI